MEARAQCASEVMVIWSEHSIARAIAMQVLDRKCLVLVDNCNWTGHECDVLGLTMDLRIIDVEVKISRADLKADAKKDKWWEHVGWGRYEMVDGKRTLVRDKPSIALDHPRKVWKHYYALPKEIWKPELLDCLPSKASGVLLLREGGWPQPPVLVECIRRPTPAKDAYRLQPAEVMDLARLANLRMWESYKKLDLAKQPVSEAA